ncbi:MAG: hypothetical protein M3O84_07505 [Actinomycetota bacterium]|nr:hypothetical protein [Actinomycetota bacterium]
MEERSWRGFLALGILSLALIAWAVPSAMAARRGPAASERIAFESGRNGGYDIFTSNGDGSDIRQVTHAAPAAAFQAAWSPDGRTLAYVLGQHGNVPPSIHLIRADGTGDHRLFDDPMYRDFNPTFSPDGTTIMFVRCRPPYGPCTLYTIGVDGRHLHILVPFTADGSDQEGRYSPDGTHVVYTEYYNRSGISAIYIARADGTHADRITPWKIEASFPNWTPDGTHVVYNTHCCDGAGSPYWIAKLDGTERQKLTHPGARHDYALDYSPDGDLIVFERDAPDYSRGGIWTMAPDGSGAARIISNAFYPSWSPVL